MDCENNYIDLKRHLEAMARTDGTLIGLPIVAVTGHTEQAIQCDDGKPRTFEALLAASIGVDSCGKPALRVKFIDTCDLHISCVNNSDERLLNQIFAYDSDLKTYALVINQSS